MITYQCLHYESVTDQWDDLKHFLVQFQQHYQLPAPAHTTDRQLLSLCYQHCCTGTENGNRNWNGNWNAKLYAHTCTIIAIQWCDRMTCLFWGSLASMWRAPTAPSIISSIYTPSYTHAHAQHMITEYIEQHMVTPTYTLLHTILTRAANGK